MYPRDSTGQMQGMPTKCIAASMGVPCISSDYHLILQSVKLQYTEVGGSPIETKLAFRRHAIIHINYKYTSSLPSKTASDMVELVEHFVNEESECSQLFVSVEPSSLVTFRSCTRSLIFCLTRREIYLAEEGRATENHLAGGERRVWRRTCLSMSPVGD